MTTNDSSRQRIMIRGLSSSFLHEYCIKSFYMPIRSSRNEMVIMILLIQIVVAPPARAASEILNSFPYYYYLLLLLLHTDSLSASERERESFSPYYVLFL